MLLFSAGEVVIDSWLQYGSWGVLVLIMLFIVIKAIPKMFDYHKEVVGKIVDDHKVSVVKLTDDNKEAVNSLAQEHKAVVREIVCSFEKENEHCRLERLDTAKLFVTEQEKNRESKAAMMREFHDTISKFAPQ